MRGVAVQALAAATARLAITAIRLGLMSDLHASADYRANLIAVAATARLAITAIRLAR